ncbi:MAG: UDP-3-O-acyl-N-acetylglucosamine deacetylase [Synergistaceae bacterium]
MKTLSKEISFSGVGLHSGTTSNVTLFPSDREGIYFRTPTGIFPLKDASVAEDNRLTGFKLSDGTLVRTAEHLLAAIAGMGIESLEVFLQGEEPPILDGSSNIFAQKIYDTGLIDNGVSSCKFFLSNPVYASDPLSEKVICAIPSQDLKITYVIDYSGTPIGVQRVTFTISESIFLDTISKARTFGHTYEFDYLKANGLAKGGSLDNALVFDKDKLLNDSGLRFPLECVTHKVVDLLGDLTLVGKIPVAHYISICGGHALHSKLVDKIKRLI